MGMMMPGPDMNPLAYVGPCGCMTNGCANCLQMTCCAPCHFGKAMEKAQLCGGCVPSCVLFICCPPLMLCNSRGLIRAKYGIQGNAVMDCIETCVCPCIFLEPCRMIQEVQIRERDIFGCV